MPMEQVDRDYYLIHGGDDVVVSTDGSDEFDIGFDASDGEYSSGIVYNALYDANGVVIQEHEDYADDLDGISFQNMPEGVRVDVNKALIIYSWYQISNIPLNLRVLRATSLQIMTIPFLRWWWSV